MIMKSELEYLKLAFEEWCRKYSRHLPLTPASIAAVLAIADTLRSADAAKLDNQEPTK